jgi:thiol:disulfide interchange protein DsbC
MSQHRPTLFLLILLSLLASTPALADSVTDRATDRVREGIKRHTGDQVSADRVSATPIPGVFEVVTGLDVFYADATGRYAFIDGRLVDTQQKRDLTQSTLDTLSRIDFKSLPLNLAIKTVTGTGKRQLAIFEDPTCPACQALHGALGQLKDVTLYTFAYPIISENAIPAAVATLCAPAAIRAAKWNGYMQGRPLPETIDAGCDRAQADLQAILALGDKYRVRNTPTLFLGNGKRVVGGIPPEQLAAALDELGQ